MYQESADVRWDVMAPLYDLQRRVTPDSRSAEVVDRALSLCVERSFSTLDPVLLGRSVWQNARFIVDRARNRAEEINQRLALELGGKRLEDGVVPAPGLADAPSPQQVEDVCGVRENIARLRLAVATLGPSASLTLEGMLLEETAAETAAHTGVALRTVHRLRTRIREVARPILEAA
jgi:hypothetical protein